MPTGKDEVTAAGEVQRGDETEHANQARASVGTRVLIVDDMADNRELYASAFAEAGFEVDRAENGFEALAKMDKTSFDVVIMDLAMPDLDGWEATRRIKDSVPSNVLVVVVTGHATALGLERARDAGADYVCTKPCLSADLVSLVKRALEKTPAPS
jgi:two-component system, cell cycle response regulator DivK